MLNEPVEKADSSTFDIDYIGIKASQFSFARLHKADPVLGVDMSSTGEVGCLGADFEEALLNAMISVGHRVPQKDKAVLVSSGDAKGKVDMLDCCKMLAENGYKLYATEGTAKFLESNGVKANPVCWPDEEGENILDLIANHTIDMVINIPKNHTKRELTNGYKIRRSAIDHNIPLLTNARLAAAYIRAFTNKPINEINISAWSEY
jgi:carbamoyl-phosphate synthase large subunit